MEPDEDTAMAIPIEHQDAMDLRRYLRRCKESGVEPMVKLFDSLSFETVCDFVRNDGDDNEENLSGETSVGLKEGRE